MNNKELIKKYPFQVLLITIFKGLYKLQLISIIILAIYIAYQGVEQFSYSQLIELFGLAILGSLFFKFNAMIIFSKLVKKLQN